MRAGISIKSSKSHAHVRRPAGFTLIETIVAAAIMVLVLAGGIAFMSMASVSISGITAQALISQQAGQTIEAIQGRCRVSTSNNVDNTGSILSLAFDDDPTVDSDNDGKPYNDTDHIEQFQFVGLQTTNLALAATNQLIYIPNTRSNFSVTLISKGVRSLPGFTIFSITNRVTTLIRFGLVDNNSRDFYQAEEVQGMAVSLNRPRTTNIVAFLP